MTRRSCVVTGGARGIGRAIAETLVEAGWAVVVLDLDNHALDALPEALLGVCGDASDEAAAAIAAETAAAAAPLAGWVNNAASFETASLHEAGSSAAIERSLQTNLLSAVVGSAVAVRRFIDAAEGSIVNISSPHAHHPHPGWTAYSIAKAGIDALTRAVAVEYGRYGIRCNGVAPGLTTTGRLEVELEGLDARSAKERESRLSAGRPLNRIGEPREIAEVVAFLLDSRSSFVTGATIPVDGGESAFTLSPVEREPH